MRERPNEGEPWKPLHVEMQRHDYPGKLLVVDGIDGSGKSTLLAELAKYLNERGQRNILTKTPSDDVRNMRCWRDWHRPDGPDRSLMHGYGLTIIAWGDRLVHQRSTIEPNLKAGTCVLVDRYFMSPLAFECGIVHKELCELLIRPDLSVLLDVPADLALSRIKARRNEQTHPGDDAELQVIRRRMLELANLNDDVVVVPSSRDVKDTLAQVEGHIDHLLDASDGR